MIICLFVDSFFNAICYLVSIHKRHLSARGGVFALLKSSK